MNSETKSNNIQKSDTWFRFAAAILIPLVILFVSKSYNKNQARIRTSQEYVKLGISILRDTPTNENRPLRRWGAKLLAEYAPVNVKPDSLTIKAMINQPIYYGTIPDGHGGRVVGVTLGPCPLGTEPDSTGSGCIAITPKKNQFINH
jgi:hypothetical protein